MRYYVWIFCSLLLVTLTAATSGPPILHCREDAAPAQFNFSMPTWTKPTPLVIVHPDGRAMMTRYGHFRPMRDGEFYERISNVETRHDKISFMLNGLSANDARNYICRDGAVTGRIVGLCGQDLHFIDVKMPHVRKSGLAVRNQIFHLNCEVYVPDEAPRLGLSFSFRWFKDGQPIPDRHGRVLTFPSVQLSDQGEYTCQVIEETKGCGSSPKSFPFTLDVIIPPSVSIKRHGQRDHIIGYLDTTLTLTCAVKEAFPRVPPNGFSWTFSPSDSSPAQQLPGTGDTLTLGPLTREDTGLYTCRARNDQNYQDHPRKWSSGTDSINVTVIYLEKMSLTPAIEVREGDSFTLTCSVDSSPTAQLQWLVNGVFRRESFGNVDDYKIQSTTVRDTGNYTCHANNSYNLQTSAWTNVSMMSGSNGDLDKHVQYSREKEQSQKTVASGGDLGGGNCISSSSLLVFFTMVLVLQLQ